MYAITGASGRVGTVVCNELIANGKNVLAIGRNRDKLENLVVKGAAPLVGELSDAGFIKKAFEGATAVLLIVPLTPQSRDPRKDQQAIARNYVEAIKSNGIKNVVIISSVGAHLKNGAGVVDGLADLEGYLSELKNINVLSLRAAYFMENIFMQQSMIQQMNIMGSPLKGDVKLPMVAVKDIAAVASKRLLDLNFRGFTVEYILGQRDISYDEVTRIIGNAIGKPDLKYVQVSYEDAKKSMVQTGTFSENVADLFNQMVDAINSGRMGAHHKRTPDNSTPTSIEEFSKTFANAYHSSQLVEH